METVRLYTGTAAIVHFGKETIRPTDGWADVPPSLVPHLLKTGWSRNAPPPEAAPEDMKHALDVPELAAIEGGEAITAAISVENQPHTSVTGDAP